MKIFGMILLIASFGLVGCGQAVQTVQTPLDVAGHLVEAGVGVASDGFRSGHEGSK